MASRMRRASCKPIIARSVIENLEIEAWRPSAERACARDIDISRGGIDAALMSKRKTGRCTASSLAVVKAAALMHRAIFILRGVAFWR